MKFIKVNHSLNESYNVEDNAIIDIVESVFKKIKGVKLINLNIIINDFKNGYEAIMTAKKDKNASYYELTKKIEKNIKDLSVNLISSAPDNLRIFFEE